MPMPLSRSCTIKFQLAPPHLDKHSTSASISCPYRYICEFPEHVLQSFGPTNDVTLGVESCGADGKTRASRA
eukprot:971250-Amphidinium_carterae.2